MAIDPQGLGGKSDPKAGRQRISPPLSIMRLAFSP
jgi:hypothetical protein